MALEIGLNDVDDSGCCSGGGGSRGGNRGLIRLRFMTVVLRSNEILPVRRDLESEIDEHDQTKTLTCRKSNEKTNEKGMFGTMTLALKLADAARGASTMGLKVVAKIWV